MDKIRQYIENNRKQAMLFGGLGLVLLILIVFGITKLLAPAPAEESADAGGGFAPAPSVPGPAGGFPGGPPVPMTPGGPAGMPSPAGSAAGPAGVPSPSAPAAPAAPEAAAPAAEGVVPPSTDEGAAPAAAGPRGKAKKAEVLPSLYKARKDPFAPPGLEGLDRKKLLAKQQRIMAALKEQAIRSQLASLPTPSIFRPKRVQVVENTADQTAVTPVVRRVAGLLYGDRVLGVLETDGKTNVVKLGDVLTSGPDRVKVTRIDRSGITLRKLGKEGGNIVVPLKAAPEGGVTGGAAGLPSPTPFRRPGGPGMPGMPGMAGGPPLPL